MAPYFKASLLETVKIEPYSLAVDGSNDNGLQKMNRLTVRIFDVQRGCVTTQLLDICLTSRQDGGTAAAYLKRLMKKRTKMKSPGLTALGLVLTMQV